MLTGNRAVGEVSYNDGVRLAERKQLLVGKSTQK